MASGTALLSAAVKAACQAKAPRRTIAAIAAAVTQVLTHPVPAAVATPATVPDVPLGSLESQDELELKLREVRLAKRRAKRQRRRAKAKAAASMADAKKPFASTWDEVPQQLISTSGICEMDADIAEPSEVKAATQTKWRPVPQVDPQFLAEMERERERQALGHVGTSLTPVVSATHGAKGRKPKPDHSQQPARRGPY